MTRFSHSTHISVVSPVYNAAPMVEELCNRIRDSVCQITEDFEIILIDDSSSDDSWNAIVKASKWDSRIFGFKLSRNFGQHIAIAAGIQRAKGDWVVVLDCDLQDPPEMIPILYRKAIESQCEVAIATFSQRSRTRIEAITSKSFWKLLSYLTGIRFDPRHGNFRIFSRKVAEATMQFKEKDRYLGALIALSGFAVTELELVRADRPVGKSSYTTRTRFRQAINFSFAYSTKPLTIMTSLGLLSSLTGLIGILYVFIVRALSGISVPGWAGLIALLLLIGSLLSLHLGVIGAYLSRVLSESRGRPIYFVAAETSGVDSSARIPSKVEKFPTHNAVIWITGLSGSGKTTLAHAVLRLLKANGVHAVHIDGDNMRQTIALLDLEFGYQPDDRKRLGLFYSKMASLLALQGNVVVVSTISMYNEVFRLNRLSNHTYLEVFLDVSPTLRQRRIKQRLEMQDVGTDSIPIPNDPEVDFPVNSDFVFTDSDQTKTTIDEMAQQICMRVSVMIQK